jgi:nucleotide-binding universal stress UspA family protein
VKKLLLPADGSPASQRAAEVAVRMLHGEPSAKVLLLHVYPPIMAWEVSPHVTAQMVQQIHEKAGREALKGARAALECAGVACEERLLEGDPGAIIADVAGLEGVEGIVMGTRGLGPVKSLVLGSVANKVVHLSEVPVTLVK